MNLNFCVITPAGIMRAGYAEEVIVPSSTGQVGILNNHAFLLTALDIGLMRVKTGDEWFSIFLVEGVAQVEQNEITVVSREAEEGVLIDPFDAKVRLQTITKLSKKAVTKKEKIDMTLELRKAKTKLESTVPFKI
jgi:F-type H+-transporting ATPase subunit epsilon